jgi:integrase
VSSETISRYLQGYLDKAPKTYNKQITGLRRFDRDFLRLPQLIASFRMAPVDTCQFYEDLPSKAQVRKGFNGLADVRAKTICLFAATTGLRKCEILGLSQSQVNFETHAVVPNHFTRKKRSGIAFYNDETSLWLQKYLGERKDNSEKLFAISDRQWRKIGKMLRKVRVLRLLLRC